MQPCAGELTRNNSRPPPPPVNFRPPAPTGPAAAPVARLDRHPGSAGTSIATTVTGAFSVSGVTSLILRSPGFMYHHRVDQRLDPGVRSTPVGTSRQSRPR
jgi:hypothetical protein